MCVRVEFGVFGEGVCKQAVNSRRRENLSGVHLSLAEDHQNTQRSQNTCIPLA